MEQTKTLGGRIQAFRKTAGLSQEALGEQLGVSRQAVSRWESDAAVPELEKLIAMSRLFGVTGGGCWAWTPREEQDTSSQGAAEAADSWIWRRKPSPAHELQTGS